MEKLDLQRIINNESIVKELEMLNAHLGSELSQCDRFSLSGKDCQKYGLKRDGLIASVISKFISAKIPVENPTGK